MHSEGMSQPKIADQTGLHVVTVNRILNDTQAKNILQHTTDLHLIAHKAITKQKIGLCFNPNKAIALKAIDMHDQTIGIRGAHTQQNVFVNNLYQQNNALSLTPDVLRLLSSNGIDATIDIPGYGDDEA